MKRQGAVAQEARAMTREQVMRWALEGSMTWEQAATICQLTPRYLRWLRARYELLDCMPQDGRLDRPMPRRSPQEVVDRVVAIRKERYPDWSLKHLHERLVERHKISISCTWLRAVMVNAGLHEAAPGAAADARHAAALRRLHPLSSSARSPDAMLRGSPRARPRCDGLPSPGNVERHISWVM
jgi:hypothetical protein